MKNERIVSDLYTVKYNQSEAVARKQLQDTLDTGCVCGLIIPASLLSTVRKHNDIEVHRSGKAYAAQGLTEECYTIIRKKPVEVTK